MASYKYQTTTLAKNLRKCLSILKLRASIPPEHQTIVTENLESQRIF